MQRGALQRGGASLASKAQHENPEACNVKLRCMHPVSLSELLTAHSVFDLDLPDHVASAALNQPESNGHPNGHSTHPELAQTEPSLGKADLHTSASLGAVTGAAAPAYATQMDAPTCDFDASATAKAATAAAAVAAEQNAAGDVTAVDGASLTRDKPNSQRSTDAAIPMKTKTGVPKLCNINHAVASGLCLCFNTDVQTSCIACNATGIGSIMVVHGIPLHQPSCMCLQR